jgi:DNA repair protein RadA/Sms
MAALKALKMKPAMRACERCKTIFPAEKALCPSCKLWHLKPGAGSGSATGKPLTQDTDQTVKLSDVQGEADRRYLFTGDMKWLNTVLGTGLVTNSTVLFGGDPGAGKSSLSIQMAVALALAVPDRPGTNESSEVLYIGAEETALATKARAIRFGLTEHLHKVRMYPLGATADIGAIIMLRKPKAVFLDSLPKFTKDPIEAVELCAIFKELAVAIEAPFIVIDQVTKSGDFAGLKKLEHEVDTCAIMSPVDDSRDNEMREITVTKNRNGVANFITRVRMTGTGIVYLESDQEDDPAYAKEEEEE